MAIEKLKKNMWSSHGYDVYERSSGPMSIPKNVYVFLIYISEFAPMSLPPPPTLVFSDQIAEYDLEI